MNTKIRAIIFALAASASIGVAPVAPVAAHAAHGDRVKVPYDPYVVIR